MRRIWRWLWVWTVIWTLVRLPGAGGAWHYFSTGATLLVGDDPGQGLQLYASHPELQIGPLAFLIALPFDLLDGGRAIGVVAMSATGPPLLAAIWRLVPPERQDPRRLLVAGLIFLPIWAELATHAGHLDDVLALSLAIGAMHARLHERPVLTGLLIAAAADSKPWAAAFAALLLHRPPRWTLTALAAFAAGVAVAWLPFLLYDPHTLQAARFTIDNAAGSGLRVLGYQGAGTPPWDRPAQIVLGVLLGAIAVHRKHWEAVILLGTAARILLDPEVYGYYTSGVMLGAVTFDLIATRGRFPQVTVTAAATLYLARLLTNIHLLPLTNPDLGCLRVLFFGAAVIAVFTAATVRANPAQASRRLRV